VEEHVAEISAPPAPKAAVKAPPANNPKAVVATPPANNKKPPAKKAKAAEAAVRPAPQKAPSKAPARIGPVPIAARPTAGTGRAPSFKKYYVGAAGLAAVLIVGLLLRAFSPHSPEAVSTLPSNLSNLVTVRIDSDPSGAKIRVNDQSCKVPDCELRLAPGNYEIEAQLDGRETSHQPLVVKDGETSASVTVALAPKIVSSGSVANASKNPEVAAPTPTPTLPKRTAVEFFGVLPATTIRIDGRSVGQINTSGGMTVDVAPGTHNIELVQNGFMPLALRKTVAADHMVRLGPKELLFKPNPAAVVRKSLPPEQPPAVVTPKTEPAVAAVVKAPPTPPAPDPASTEWQKISATHDQNVLSEFIRKFPNSPQAVDANRRLGQLRDEAARSATEKASSEMAATRSAIQQTLSRYAQAYRDRDANAVASVWPSLNKQDLKRIQESFKAASSIQMSIHPVGDPDINGDLAQVICSRSLQFTFPQGVQKPLQDKVTVQMHKQNGLWVIDKIQ